MRLEDRTWLWISADPGPRWPRPGIDYFDGLPLLLPRVVDSASCRPRAMAAATARAMTSLISPLVDADGSIGQAVTVGGELALELGGARSVLGVLRSPMEEARLQSGHP